MHRKGSINKTTLCQRSETDGWVEVDEILPLLKYYVETPPNGSWCVNSKKSYRWPVLVGIGTGMLGILFFVLLAQLSPKPQPGSDNLATIVSYKPIDNSSTKPIIKSLIYRPSQQSYTQIVQPNQPPHVSTPPVPDQPAEIRNPAPEIVLPLATRRRQKEFQVPIFKDINMANFGGPDVWCRITQDNPSAIFIAWGGGRNRPTRYEKITGFEGKNYTTLISATGGILYLVDSPRADPGKRIFVVD